MLKIEITRHADVSVFDQLAEMRAWLDCQGIRASNLRAVRVMAGRNVFTANVETTEEADRFRGAFGDTD